MEVSVAAQNAQLTVNNVAIENSSNTISDALENITLNLNDVTTGNQTLTIVSDGRSEGFEIDAYKKRCLENGYDDVDYLRSIADRIEAFEAARK